MSPTIGSEDTFALTLMTLLSMKKFLDLIETGFLLLAANFGKPLYTAVNIVNGFSRHPGILINIPVGTVKLSFTFSHLALGREDVYAPGGPAFIAHTNQKVINIVGLRPYG